MEGMALSIFYLLQSVESRIMTRIVSLLLIVLIGMQIGAGDAFLFGRINAGESPGLVGQLHQISRRSAQVEIDDAKDRRIQADV